MQHRSKNLLAALHLIEASIGTAFAHDPDPRHLQANSTVQVFDKTTGKYLIQFAGKGDGHENMEKPGASPWTRRAMCL